MSMSVKIKTILYMKKMTIKQLSDKLGYKGFNFYAKLNKDNFTEEELKKIADALNCDYEGVFTFRDSGRKF